MTTFPHQSGQWDTLGSLIIAAVSVLRTPFTDVDGHTDLEVPAVVSELVGALAGAVDAVDAAGGVEVEVDDVVEVGQQRLVVLAVIIVQVGAGHLTTVQNGRLNTQSQTGLTGSAIRGL